MFLVSGGLQKNLEMSSQRLCRSWGFSCCSVSSFLTLSFSDLRRKSPPFSLLTPGLFGIPQTEHWATTLILDPPLPSFQSLSRRQSQVTCYSVLCLACVPHTQQQGRDFTGVAFRTTTSQSTHHVSQVANKSSEEDICNKHGPISNSPDRPRVVRFT